MGNQETVSLPTKENIPAMASCMKMHTEEVGFTRGKGGMFSSTLLSDSHKCESSVFYLMARNMPRISVYRKDRHNITETEGVG